MPGEDSRRYDVFLSHNSDDRAAVELLAHKLLEAGVRPWLDAWNLKPGQPWQSDLERALDSCDSCAVFIGPSGVVSPWQHEEMRAAIDRRVTNANSAFPVIPVLLPGGRREDRSRLPAFLRAATWVEFDFLGDAEAFRRLVCGIHNIEPGPEPSKDTYTGESPYRGLLFFDVENAPFFFGREGLVEWLIHELRPVVQSEDKTRFLAVIGPSGSGKSSLARAGLVAALKRGAIGASMHWPTAVLRPGADPLVSVAVAVHEAMGGVPTPHDVGELASELTQNERALHQHVHLALRVAPPDRRFVLLIDQFEEMFTLCDDPSARDAVINNLMYACTVTGGQTTVLITLRADYYGECSPYTALAAAISERQMLVGAMEPAQLRKAIERPAQLAGCELEPGLANTLIEEIKGQPGGLPLLEDTLAELWNRRRDGRLTHSAYEEIGRVAGALERRADQVYKSFSADEQEICRRVFMQLVQLSGRGHATKRQARLSELLPAEGDDAEVRKVIDKLARREARLIVVKASAAAAVQAAGGSVTHTAAQTDASPADSELVDVAHEALIGAWGQLRRWMDDDEAFLLWRKGLSFEIDQWEQAGRAEDTLLHGGLLLRAKHWREARKNELNREEREFIGASEDHGQKLQEEEAKRAQELEMEHEQRAQAEKRAARRKKIAWASSAAFVITAVIGRIAYIEVKTLNRAKDLADQARDIRSVDLAVQAYRESPVQQAVAALYATAFQDMPALPNSSNDPYDHVNDVAWNASRTYIATAHAKRGVVLWKSADPSPEAWNAFNEEGKYPHPAEVLSVAFHPRDDSFLTATGAPDSRLRSWRVGADRPDWISESSGDDDVIAACIAHSGNVMAAITRSGKVTVWNRDTNARRSINPPYSGTTLAASPVEDRIAAGFADGTIVWWNVGVESYESVPGEERRGRVHNVALSPNGKRLAIASERGVFVWQTDSRDAPKAATTSREAVMVAVAFSPRGDRIAAADADGFVSIIDAAGLREQFRLAAPGIGKLTAVAFQPDPKQTGSAKLAVSGDLASVRIFELNVDLLLKSVGSK